MKRAIAYVLALATAIVNVPVSLAAASEHYGQVTVAGVAIPGATVTATRGDHRLVVYTDAQGIFRLADVEDGVWAISVEMRGFSTTSREVTTGPDAPPSMWELTLLPFEEVAKTIAPPAPPPVRPPDKAGAGQPERQQSGARTPVAVPQTGFQRAGVTAPRNSAPAPAPAAADDPPAADAAAAADGFLINGSVNNGAASPFAQAAAFGNNRRRPGSLYNGMVGAEFSNSFWDAQPYSLTGRPTLQPDYYNVNLLSTFGGPVKLPGVQNRLNFFVGFQRAVRDDASTQPALMPSVRERRGDFSETRDASGNLVQIRDPLTGLPFPGNVIPPDRISPQAASLLQYYPAATAGATGRYNYEALTLRATRSISVQTRLTQVINNRNQIQGSVSYQRSGTDSTTLFGFEDENVAPAADVQVNWSHRFGLLASSRVRYQLTQQRSEAIPYFAYRTNVSGEAGITGNNQEPANWGPPALSFASGIAGLSDGLPGLDRNLTNAVGGDFLFSRGRHSFTIGGDVRHNQVDIDSQQDPRGRFSFTGAGSGFDFADFMLGLPSTSGIAYGNADKYFRGNSYDAYITDDWRVGPSLTVTAGVRWDYESPYTELQGRLVNLDVAPDFSAIAPVVATDPTGALTGESYPSSLVRPDLAGIQPRLAVAWRPVPGSSIVIRAGYGIYRNTNLYRSLTNNMAQQPPLSNALSVSSTPDNRLTLANGFTTPEGLTANTFAVDPDFRNGSAHNWQASIQRDLPASLTINASYLGSRGTGLIREFLPNTYPRGGVNPCAACPAGFVYLTSDGTSSRHAGQIQVRRRLRSGFTATVQYTLARAFDNAASYQGANLSGTAFAQDWLNLDAEYAPSSFDQRHLMTVQFQYSTGVGVAGGALIDGWQGALLKGWTLIGQMTTGSGLPLTPYFLTPTAGTGYSGATRASLTGESTAAPEGYYLNPAAYRAPDPGSWGDAGRNSGTGPAQFQMNAGVQRTFQLGGRYNMDFRIDATNVLNVVTYSNINAVVGSPQFGLPESANQMRRVTSSLRLRF